MKQKYKSPGFTLIELLVVVSIISLLASITLVAVVNARQKSIATTASESAKQYEQAIKLYAYDHGYFPWSTAGNGSIRCIGELSDTCNYYDWIISPIAAFNTELAPYTSNKFPQIVTGNVNINGSTLNAGTYNCAAFTNSPPKCLKPDIEWAIPYTDCIYGTRIWTDGRNSICSITIDISKGY